MRQVRRAALAPAEPSSADRSVAASASQREREAQAEIQELAAEELKATHQHRALESKNSEEGEQEGSGEQLTNVHNKDLNPQASPKRRRLTPSPNRGKIWR